MIIIKRFPNWISPFNGINSADPILIRNLSELDDLTIISNSDAHSVNYHRLGREATKINISNNLNYQEIINSIRFNKIIKTYEFKPSGGKYYYDIVVFSLFPNLSIKL